ncbi:TATA box-binding protein-associated factor RNA polymerase I subunit A-like [Asterias rubens]|uniref:TATA box-binding protein-associated factor RNA polymerase I subunit A-like n=1 Tax=Asterias rubens TaxID=7604 RepID=UPI0014555E24|nr:TATA box-binding protein-associated factor RNA polymerase I subunit A-like [Asterias rubens]
MTMDKSKDQESSGDDFQTDGKTLHDAESINDASKDVSDADTSDTSILDSDDPGNLEDEEEKEEEHLPGLKDFLKKNVTDRFSVGEKTGLPLLLACLRECLLTHRWNEASHAVEMMCLYPTQQYEDYVWKCGVEILYSHPGSDPALIEQFNSKLEGVNKQLKKKRLEKVFYLLSRQQYKEAHLEVRSFKRSRRTKLRKEDAKTSKFWELLINSYSGMLQYMTWHQNFESVDRESQEADTAESGEFEVRRACVSLGKLSGRPGVWDIFITKHVEILETTGKIEEAKEVLEKYCTQCQDNPNAFRYLYRFLKRNNGSESNLMQILKEFVRRVPSDPLALELVRLQQLAVKSKKKKKHNERIHAFTNTLFNMLDYPYWYKKLKPWKILSKHLTKVFRRQDTVAIKAAQDCWSMRNWWPSYHFDVKSAQGLLKSNKKVVLQKALVAIFLHTPESQFVHIVKKHFMKKDETKYIKLLEDAAELFEEYDLVS